MIKAGIIALNTFRGESFFIFNIKGKITIPWIRFAPMTQSPYKKSSFICPFWVEILSVNCAVKANIAIGIRKISAEVIFKRASNSP